MTRFKRAQLKFAKDPAEHVAEVSDALGVKLSDADAKRLVASICEEIVYLNDTYQVNVRDCGNPPPGWPPMKHLSIKRIDKQPVHDWRHFQQIKDELCGPEWEAVELYPAQSRLVDTANQYHLWAVPMRFPFGMNDRLVSDVSACGAVQRPNNEG